MFSMCIARWFGHSVCRPVVLHKPLAGVYDVSCARARKALGHWTSSQTHKRKRTNTQHKSVAAWQQGNRSIVRDCVDFVYDVVNYKYSVHDLVEHYILARHNVVGVQLYARRAHSTKYKNKVEQNGVSTYTHTNIRI